MWKRLDQCDDQVGAYLSSVLFAVWPVVGHSLLRYSVRFRDVYLPGLYFHALTL
jgi:hypothetical protein